MFTVWRKDLEVMIIKAGQKKLVSFFAVTVTGACCLLCVRIKSPRNLASTSQRYPTPEHNGLLWTKPHGQDQLTLSFNIAISPPGRFSSPPLPLLSPLFVTIQPDTPVL